MNAPVQHEAGSLHAQTAPNSSLVLQIDKGIGKQFLLIVWLSAFTAALAVVGLMVAWSAYRDTRAHVNTMQYDLAQVKAQLIERGMYEPTSH